MKILVVSAILPYPLHSGGQVRLYNLLKHCAQTHDITLYTYIRSEDEKQYIRSLPFLSSVHVYMRGRVWQPRYFLRALSSNRSLLSSSYDHREMREAIREDLARNQYDLIHLEPFYVMGVLPEDVRIPVVVGEHNIEYEVYGSYRTQSGNPLLKPLYAMDIAKIRREEEASWKRASGIIAVSDGDREVIAQTVPQAKIAVVPNGVDTKVIRHRSHTPDPKKPTFLFTGNFRWMPNTNAVRKLLDTIWPQISASFPKATLRIVGRDLPGALRDRCTGNGCTYAEWVEDIRTEYSRADFLLAPMTIAGGTKFKVLEAMAAGCVVLTSQAGIGGIGAVPGKEFVLVNSDDAYAGEIGRILARPQTYAAIAASARKLIETKYDWSAIAQIQDTFWRSLA